MTKKKKTRWVPKVGERFWKFTDTLEIYDEEYNDHPFNMGIFYIRAGNCFRTKREAQKAAKAIDKILRGFYDNSHTV